MPSRSTFTRASLASLAAVAFTASGLTTVSQAQATQPAAPSGAQQPTAPGYRPAAALATLRLIPAIPAVKRIEYLSNGNIEVAHAVVLVAHAERSLPRSLALAQLVAARTLATRSSLREVDISLYQREGYAGFGGPSPLFTASVPRPRAAEFGRVKPTILDEYDRLWANPVATPLPPQLEPTGETPTGVPEAKAALIGTVTPAERLEQSRAQNEGGARGGLLFRGNPNRGNAALTFDDAPHPLYVPLILDSLRRGGAKATFFVIGRNAAAYPYFIRDMVAAGHEVANHTYNHVRLVGLRPAVIQNELAQTNALIKQLTGETVRYFRPPGGRYSSLVLNTAKKMSLTTAFWTNDPADFNNPGAALLEARFLKFLQPGGIILLHDNATQTAGLLLDFINDANALKIKLVTLETLAQP